MHLAKHPARADQLHLPLDRLARVLIVPRAVAGDEQRNVRRQRRPWERMLRHHLACPRHDHVRHAVVRPDGTAVIQSLTAALLNTREFALPLGAKAQLARDHLLREIALADEQRHEKTRGANTPRSTPATPGSSFQKPSTTCAKIPRRRSSSACW